MRARVLRCVAPRCGRAVWSGDASCRGYAARIASRRTKGRRTHARVRASARGRGGGTSACAPSTSALRVRRTLCSASAATPSPRGRSPKPLCTGGALALAGDLLRPARALVGEAPQCAGEPPRRESLPLRQVVRLFQPTHPRCTTAQFSFRFYLWITDERACVFMCCFVVFLKTVFFCFFWKYFGCILMVNGCSRMRGLWIQRTHTA